MSNLYIIIPVLNEAENIPKLASNLKELTNLISSSYVPYFIFVDDGSKDNTNLEINKHFIGMNCQILRHETNHGPGRAFATGFSSLENKLKDDDWVLTMEGDNTSSHELVPKMFRRAEEGYEVILASPYIYGGTIINTTRFRKLLSFGSNLILKELLGLRGIFTMSSFFRLYRGRVIKQMQTAFGPAIIQTKGFEGVVELLMKLVSANITISEVPLVLDTSKRKGKSEMKVLKTTINLLMLFKYKVQWRGALKPLIEVPQV